MLRHLFGLNSGHSTCIQSCYLFCVKFNLDNSKHTVDKADCVCMIVGEFLILLYGVELNMYIQTGKYILIHSVLEIIGFRINVYLFLEDPDRSSQFDSIRLIL